MSAPQPLVSSVSAPTTVAQQPAPAVAAVAVSHSTSTLNTNVANAGPAGKPSAATSTSSVVQAAPKPKPTSVWKLYPTDDGEDYYYFNDQTGESIWELPESEILT